MKIEVKEVKDQADGSAILTVEYDEEGKQLLLEEGIMSILKGYIERKNNGS